MSLMSFWNQGIRGGAPAGIILLPIILAMVPIRPVLPACSRMDFIIYVWFFRWCLLPRIKKVFEGFRKGRAMSLGFPGIRTNTLVTPSGRNVLPEHGRRSPTPCSIVMTVCCPLYKNKEPSFMFGILIFRLFQYQVHRQFSELLLPLSYL